MGQYCGFVKECVDAYIGVHPLMITQIKEFWPILLVMVIILVSKK